MSTEQELMNNAFKDLLFHEENMAKKYAAISEQITNPKIQKMLQGLEQGARKLSYIDTDYVEVFNCLKGVMLYE